MQNEPNPHPDERSQHAPILDGLPSTTTTTEDRYEKQDTNGDVAGVNTVREEPTNEAHIENQPAHQETPQVTVNRPKRRKKSRYFGLPKGVPQQANVYLDDYEQKYPDDLPGEHLGPNARFYRVYLDEHERFRFEKVEGWRDNLDVLLVFAGLFSAVVTTIVVEASRSLQPDYAQLTTSLLVQQSTILTQMLSLQRGKVLNDSMVIEQVDMSFVASRSARWVNGLWFSSLALSLCTALIAVVAKQWLQNYMTSPTGSPQQRARILHMRYLVLRQWRVAAIIGLLPFLLHLSLLLFSCGLVIFLIPIDQTIGIAVGALALTFYLAYLATAALPIISPRCPFKTPLILRQLVLMALVPLERMVYRSYTVTPPGLRKAGNCNIRLRVLGWLVDIQYRLRQVRTHALREIHQLDTDHLVQQLDNQMLLWMHSFSFSPSATSITLQASSALSAKWFEQGGSELYLTLKREIDQCFPWDTRVVSKLDRLSQTLVSCPDPRNPLSRYSPGNSVNQILKAGIDGLPLQSTTWVALLGRCPTPCQGWVVLQYWRPSWFIPSHWDMDLCELDDYSEMTALSQVLHGHLKMGVLRAICGSYASTMKGKAIGGFFSKLAESETEFIMKAHLPIMAFVALFTQNLQDDDGQVIEEPYLIHAFEKLVPHLCNILQSGQFGDCGPQIYLDLFSLFSAWILQGRHATNLHLIYGFGLNDLTSQHQERLKALDIHAMKCVKEFQEQQLTDEHMRSAEAGCSRLVSSNSDLHLELKEDVISKNESHSPNFISKIKEWMFSKRM